jgi:hypothetical protein
VEPICAQAHGWRSHVSPGLPLRSLSVVAFACFHLLQPRYFAVWLPLQLLHLTRWVGNGANVATRREGDKWPFKELREGGIMLFT